MKIAIHHRQGSFSERWIRYCEGKSIEYKLVNVYDSDIVQQLQDCDAFLWHFHHADYRDNLFAKPLILSLQQSGKAVFPDSNTAWHFDDKIGEKYLLEALHVPMVRSYVFYDKAEALHWIKQQTFPLVFKLRGGAGASNVMLLRKQSEAKHVIRKAFGNGFSPISSWKALKETFRLYRKGKKRLKDVIYKIQFLFYTPTERKMLSAQKGYAYFQDFVAGNDSDIRVIIIGDKGFAIKRMVREGDFRASGSGNILYDKKEIDEACVRLAFEANKHIQSQCIAFDFVHDSSHTPLIVETSFGFSMHGYDACPGFWTDDMVWHEGEFCPQDWMIENLLKQVTE